MTEGPGADPPPVSPQSERDELTEDGEGSIRSSEEGPGDTGKPQGQEGRGRGRGRHSWSLMLWSHLGVPSVHSPSRERRVRTRGEEPWTAGEPGVSLEPIGQNGKECHFLS